MIVRWVVLSKGGGICEPTDEDERRLTLPFRGKATQSAAPGTAWHQIALEPFRRYPGLHSNRTTEPVENSDPMRRPYRGSGTELHWLSLVRGTATVEMWRGTRELAGSGGENWEQI
ncbi:hypothetical protein EYF80_017405 [Liparis tanakae]|uniref:Uncharacterized protein n=1 Tax=Liparis tanakae TaxID=230148 RepID=A0A4Z2I2S1_9TELE|nr:hypothetical protein EYF80_017405 [Liparis tanakae]